MTQLSQLAEQIAGKMPIATAQSRLYMRAVADLHLGSFKAADRIVAWVLRSADRDALIHTLAVAYIEKIVRADIAGRVTKSNVGPTREQPAAGLATIARTSDAGEAMIGAPVTGQTLIASPATTVHDGTAKQPVPNGHGANAPAVMKPNPPRSTPATMRLVQSDADRAYFKTFLVRDVPIGEIRLGTAKTMAAQNEREARILRICIDYAGGSDDGLRLDEIVPPRILAEAIRSNGGGRHV